MCSRRSKSSLGPLYFNSFKCDCATRRLARRCYHLDELHAHIFRALVASIPNCRSHCVMYVFWAKLCRLDHPSQLPSSPPSSLSSIPPPYSSPLLPLPPPLHHPAQWPALHRCEGGAGDGVGGGPAGGQGGGAHAEAQGGLAPRQRGHHPGRHRVQRQLH